MSLSLLKSILHNIGVVIVGPGFAYLGTRGFCLSWHESRFTSRYQEISFFSDNDSGVAPCNHRFSPASLGNLSLLSAANESDLTRSPTGTYYLRSLSLLKKSTVSWWKCLCFFRSSATSWIASCTCSNHTPSSLSGSYDQAGGEAVSTRLWLEVESLQTPST